MKPNDEWSTELNPSNRGPLKTEPGRSGQQVANTFDGAWLAYKGMDFGSAGVNRLSIEYSGNSTNPGFCRRGSAWWRERHFGRNDSGAADGKRVGNLQSRDRPADGDAYGRT
ncbi:hypothetical protein [Paenibacillus uliginis]|uniref:hypothetical protein n=1 Tax=Paenibacillus uliginis TaxID=683737 RepID=UPI001FCDBF06|nr:hypothetical protein [Paenibacillus uliginis]